MVAVGSHSQIGSLNINLTFAEREYYTIGDK